MGATFATLDSVDVPNAFALIHEPATPPRPVTHRRRAEHALLLRAEHLAHIGSWEWDVASRQLQWSPELYRLHRMDPAAQMQLTPEIALRLIHPDDRARWQAVVAEGLRSGTSISCEYRLQLDDGSERYVQGEGEVIRDDAGLPVQVVGFVQDITERLQAQNHLHFIAHHDALTELPNRILFIDRLTQALSYARWHRRIVAVLLVDLDRFKPMNDTLGHDAGDRLLQQLATRLTQTLRERDTVARFDGDQFAVLLDDVATDNDVAKLARKILDAMAAPFQVGQHDFYLTASIGVSLYPGDGQDHAALLRNADIALHRAKELGKNNAQFYSAEMRGRALERLALENSLRRALERNEFAVFYQPQVDTRHNRLVGVEALLRWEHPELGRVAPAEFIPLLEDLGLMVPIGNWVLRCACAQARLWIKGGLAPLRMAVNLSAQQLRQPGFLQFVAALTRQYELPAGCLELEIKEHAWMQDAEQALAHLASTQRERMRLAIDDFGTGYSSLRHLNRLPIDTIKIDRSFVRDIHTNAQDAILARAIIAMANSLKVEIIAEGVENEEQLKFLQAEQCSIIQGHYICPPLPAAEATAYLISRFSV